MIDPKEHWREPDSGVRYEGRRWSSARRRGHDPRLVAGILRRHLGGDASVLDVPCGTGRLREAIEAEGRHWVGLDVSPSMLAAAEVDGHPLLCGDVEALPFPENTFDAVVCCRLLHHLGDEALLRRTIAELVRVSRDLVVASFWDAGSLPARHRRLRPRRGEGRLAHPKSDLRRAFRAAGAEVTGFRHTLRFFSRQTFVVARKRVEAPGG